MLDSHDRYATLAKLAIHGRMIRRGARSAGTRQIRPPTAVSRQTSGGGRTTIWSIADQALFSMSGLLATVVVGRSVGPDGLGAFAVALAVLFGAAGVHNALVLEPMLVFGASTLRHDLRSYLNTCIVWTIYIGLVCAISGTAILLSGRPGASATAVGTALLLSPTVFLGWTFRRAPHLLGAAHVAAQSSLGYLVVTALSLLAFSRYSAATPQWALTTMALASTAQAFIVRLRRWPTALPQSQSSELRKAAADHWHYGRWILATAAPHWVSTLGYTIIVSLTIDNTSAGLFRAVHGLALTLVLLHTALSIPRIPEFARTASDHGSVALTRPLKRLTTVYLATGLCWLCLFTIAGPLMLRTLYGSEFDTPRTFLILISLAVAIAGLGEPAAVALRALQRSTQIFLAYLAGAAVTIVVGIPVAATAGMNGVAAVMVIGAGSQSATMRWLLRRNM